MSIAFSHSRHYPVSSSVFHAACRLTVAQSLHATVEMAENIDDLIPLTLESVQQFASLVYSVRNPQFGVPHAIMYGKYRYLIEETIRHTGCGSYRALDPCAIMTREERSAELGLVPADMMQWCRHLTILGIRSTSREIASAPLASETRLHVSYTILDLSSEHQTQITMQTYFVSSVASEYDREIIMRYKASESAIVPPRSMMLLADPVVPSHLIPGFRAKADIERMARSSDTMSYDF